MKRTFGTGSLVLSMTVLAAAGGQESRGPRSSGGGSPPFQLPPPTGPHPVGTASWRLTDTSRAETLVENGGRRQVEVLAWYPTSVRRGTRAPYLREGLAEARVFAARLGASATALDQLANVESHAWLDAPPAAAERFPLLVFSHGYGSAPSAHTALLEDLASNGYVVLSVVHPYEATAVTIAGGRVASLLDDSGRPQPGFRAVLAEWGPEDETMASVTKTSDEEEQRRLLRSYLSHLAQTDIALTRWVNDTTLVLDRFFDAPRRSTAGRLAARVDRARIGAFGHSMGGVASGQFCLEDRRCRAALNLDGIPQYGTMIDRALERPFLMVYSARPGRLGASDAIYRRAATTFYRVDVRDTLHVDFTDMILWDGPLRERGILGTLAPGRAVAITREIVHQYFDHVLLDRRSPLLAGETSLPEVSVKTFRSR